MNVAIDTSVLVGLLVPNDMWHSRAVGLLAAIEDAGHIAVFFDCVAAEMVSVAVRRLHEKKLDDEVEPLLSRLDEQVPLDRLTWILPDVPTLYRRVIDLIRDTSGELNFNDALIALSCRERQIPVIASFDGDFDRVDWLKRVSTPADVAAVG